MECESIKKQTEIRFPCNLAITPGKNQYLNPGNVENLHKIFHKIMPEFFDGIEFGYLNSFVPNRQLKTKWIFSHTRPSGFRIGGAYYWKCENNCLRTPKIEGDINPSTLASNISLLYYPLPFLKIKTSVQRSPEELVQHFNLEYIFKCSTISLNIYNPSKHRGRSTLSVLRNLSDELAIGSELLVEWDKNVLMADTAFAARLNKNNYTIAASASRQGLDVSVCRKLTKDIQMGSSLVFNKNTKKARGIICYQWNFKNSTASGMIDSDWSVGFMYNKILQDFPCNFGFCVLFCVPINRFTFGIKFDVDPGLKCK